MQATRWIGIAVLGAWCATGGAAYAVDDKPARPATRAESRADVKAEHADGGKININAASKADLMTLEGVGAGAAKKIIAYREAHGPFKRPQDLAKVEGLSKAVLEKNAGRIAVK